MNILGDPGLDFIINELRLARKELREGLDSMTVRAQQQDTEHAERCNPLRSVAVAKQEEVK